MSLTWSSFWSWPSSSCCCSCWLANFSLAPSQQECSRKFSLVANPDFLQERQLYVTDDLSTSQPATTKRCQMRKTQNYEQDWLGIWKVKSYQLVKQFGFWTPFWFWSSFQDIAQNPDLDSGIQMTSKSWTRIQMIGLTIWLVWSFEFRTKIVWFLDISRFWESNN